MRSRQKWNQLLFDISKSVAAILLLVLAVNSCTREYPASVGNIIPPVVITPPASSSACSCTTSPGSTTTSPGTSTTTSPGSATTSPGTSTTSTAATKVDTLAIKPPAFSPNGGNFYFSTIVKLAADSLPPGAMYEYSTDNGNNWQTGQQFTLTTGARVLTRLRVGDKVSGSRAAVFSLFYKRLLVIGNSIMFHGPALNLGWTNSNGMAASAPEKDFVHLLTTRLQTINPATTLQLQAGTGLELDFGKPTYLMDEFDAPMQTFKPDLIVIRIGENVSDGEVQTRKFEGQFRQFIDRLIQLSSGQPVKIVTTTSVWEKPQTDAVIRKVIAEKGLTLVDLGCMVGQSQYFAGQYANKGVAAHPGDVGMQRISDMIWDKIQ